MPPEPVPEKMFLGIRLNIPKDSPTGGVMAYAHYPSDKASVYGRWIRTVNYLWLQGG